MLSPPTEHQLLILNRSRRPAPNLHVYDRFVAGFCALFITPTARSSSHCVESIDVAELPSRTRPTRSIGYCSPKQRRKPGPKAPDIKCHSGCCRNETAESNLGLPTHRRA